MKKALQLLSALLCAALLAATASAAGADALPLYRAAAKRTNAASSMQIRGTFRVSYGGNRIVFGYTLRQRVNDGGKLEAQMIITLQELNGPENTDLDFQVTCYYRDGYVYRNGYGGRLKTRMSEEEAALSMLASPDESWFDGVKVQPADSGGQMRFKVPGRQATGLMGGVFQTGVESVIGAALFAEYAPARVASTVTVGDDGYLEWQRLTYGANDGVDVRYAFDMHFSEFHKVGGFRFPADLHTYVLD